MRCPKCGYISFDHLESCKKCNKKISGAAEELAGVVYEAVSPVFLVFDYAADADTEDTDFASDENVEEYEETAELSPGDEEVEGDGEIVMDFDDDNQDFVLTEDKSKDDGLSIDFDDMEDAAPDDEITLEFDDDETEAAEAQNEGLPLDFGEIDISDLAPPADGAEEAAAETFSLNAELSLDDEPVQEAALASGATVVPGAGLEDLHIDDLDLEVAAPLVAGSKAGGKLMPSVKTGTALDDFEIDLGELTNDDK